jgi:hypothetical protein
MARNTMQQAMLNKSRADKFLLVFDIPTILKEINKNFTQDQSNETMVSDTVQFSIYGAAVPAITVPAEVARYAGSTLHVSSHSKDPFPPVTVNFKVDNQYKNYWVIYQWLNLLHDQYEGRYNQRELNETEPPDFRDYQTDLTIYGKDEFNNNRIKFTYTKAFPTTVEAIDYSYQTPEEITSGFTFVYSQLHTEVMNF